ncbi:amidase [Alcaligenaceae bacterium]|nr:amidase [Alcaligenaceae bacterium]
MKREEYKHLDGLDLAELISRREVSAADTMQCAVGLAQEFDDKFNILCHERIEESLELSARGAPATRFSGIPFLLKDSGLPARRFPSSIGSRLFADTQYAQNSTLVDRFEKAGLIPFARTRVSELCMAPTTEALANGGPTLNPWDISRSAGGSSGGSAVAVATGVVPLAHGSDGGGSVRIPAACCGIFGFKPSRTLLPLGPNRGESLGGMASDGMLSRTVRDTAALLDAVGGYEPGGPYASPPKRASFLSCTYPSLQSQPLRIGVWREAWEGIAISPECIAAVDETASLLRELGHTVIEATLPDFDYSKFVHAHATVLATNIVLLADARLRQLGRTLEEGDLEPAIADGYEVGKTISGAHYVQAINEFHMVGRKIETGMHGFDIILTPTLTSLPAKLGSLNPFGNFHEFRRKVADYTTFLAILNASGQPAASLPLTWTKAGLPVAVQLVGHFGQDDVVLRLSGELERAAPWLPVLKSKWKTQATQAVAALHG